MATSSWRGHPTIEDGLLTAGEGGPHDLREPGPVRLHARQRTLGRLEEIFPTRNFLVHEAGGPVTKLDVDANEVRRELVALIGANPQHVVPSRGPDGASATEHGEI